MAIPQTDTSGKEEQNRYDLGTKYIAHLNANMDKDLSRWLAKENGG